jgi:DNA-binding response OmpR family regulator
MKARLLIVDDELHILKAAEFKFKRQGYHVDTAYDGVQAWEMLQANRPDMLVTDLQMPRMNGLELIQKIRNDERFRDIPAILLTAKGYEVDHEDIMSRLGVCDIVSKPFSPRDLCNRVGVALAKNEERQDADAVIGAPPVELVAGQTEEGCPSTTPFTGASDTR